METDLLKCSQIKHSGIIKDMHEMPSDNAIVLRIIRKPEQEFVCFIACGTMMNNFCRTFNAISHVARSFSSGLLLALLTSFYCCGTSTISIYSKLREMNTYASHFKIRFLWHFHATSMILMVISAMQMTASWWEESKVKTTTCEWTEFKTGIPTRTLRPKASTFFVWGTFHLKMCHSIYYYSIG